MKHKMMTLTIKPPTEMQQENLIAWLTNLLDGVENSNSQALRVAQVAHCAVNPNGHDGFKDDVIDAIETGIANANDLDVSFKDLAVGAFDVLFPEVKS